jgi:hypothetical protein
MKIGKIKSRVLFKALESKKFFSLSCYLDSYQRHGEYFISIWHNAENMWDIRVALCDYCANEPESEELFRFAEELIGERRIDLTVMSETFL